MSNIQKGKVTKSELDGVKAYEWGSFQKSLQTVSALADWYQYAYLVGDIIKEYPAVEEQIFSVKPTDMKKVVNKMLETQAWGIGFMRQTKDKSPIDLVYEQLTNHYLG